MKRVLSIFSLVIVAAIILVVVLPVLAGGSPDFASYCRSRGYSGVVTTSGRDIFCEGSGFNLSVQEVCSWQYPGSTAVNPDVMNPNGWNCEGGSSTSTGSGGSPSVGGGSSGSPLNISGYCSSRGLGAPYTSGRDWFCGGSSFSVSPDEVCGWQGGGYAVNPDVLNPNGWTCGGSGNPAPVQSNPVPNNPAPTAVPQSSTGTTATGSGTSGSSNIYTGSNTPPSSGDYVQVLETSLRVRSFPTTDSQMLGYVRQWDYYPLYEIRGGWGLISGSLGSGWVSLEYVEVFQQAEENPATLATPVPQSDDPTAGMLLVWTCPVTGDLNVFMNLWFQDRGNALDLLMPRASGAFLDAVQNSLSLFGIFSEAAEMSQSNYPDWLLFNLWWDDSRDEYMEIRLMRSDGSVIERRFGPYSGGPLPDCPQGGWRA